MSISLPGAIFIGHYQRRMICMLSAYLIGRNRSYLIERCTSITPWIHKALESSFSLLM